MLFLAAVGNIGRRQRRRDLRFFDQIRGAIGEGGAAGSSGATASNIGVNRITGPQIRALVSVSESNSFDAAARLVKILEPSSQ
jgi:hypothetical protein